MYFKSILNFKSFCLISLVCRLLINVINQTIKCRINFILGVVNVCVHTQEPHPDWPVNPVPADVERKEERGE